MANLLNAAVRVASVLQGVTRSVAIRQETQAQQNLAVHQANILRTNALFMDRAAEDAMVRGNISAREAEVATADTISQQRVGLAERGIVVDQDSAADLVADTAGVGALDAFTILANAEREVEEIRFRASQEREEADLALATGQAKTRAGRTNQLTNFLATAGTVAERWNMFKKPKDA